MTLQQKDTTSNCLRAIAPIVASGAVLFDGAVAAEAGAAALPVATIASAEKAPFGGTINVSGCKNVAIEVDYLTGDDCDSCTDPDVLTVETVTFIMQANSTYEVPAGFWKEIRATLIDSAGAPVDLSATQTEKVVLHSGYQPTCMDCVVLVP